jgi:starvation-inducible DNA-binding protein
MLTGQPFRAYGTIEDNPIGLPRELVAKLIPELDKHVASLFVLFHQYQKHHWLVEGPQFMDLHKFLQKNYEEVHESVDQIAERITALGGIPTSNPVEQAKIAYVQHEPEGTFRIRDMLERDRAHEGEIAQKMRATVKLAGYDDPGTEQMMKRILFKVEDRAHHLDHFLGSDTLEMGVTAAAPDQKGKAGKTVAAPATAGHSPAPAHK